MSQSWTEYVILLPNGITYFYNSFYGGGKRKKAIQFKKKKIYESKQTHYVPSPSLPLSSLLPSNAILSLFLVLENKEANNKRQTNQSKINKNQRFKSHSFEAR